jgi:flagellar motor switch protein FliM
VTLAEPSAAAPARPQRARVGRRSRGAGPQPYDFRRPTKLSREHVRALQIVFETFARQTTTLFTSTLRVVAQVNLVSIEQQTYDEYVGTLGNPTLMAIISAEPLNGAGVIEMSLPATMTAIDHMLGGPGTGAQPERPLSDIETHLARGLLERMLGELRYAFESVVRIEPSLEGIEYNPQFAQVTSASDMVLVASFDVRIGNQECLATVCLPFNPLFARLEAVTGQVATSERERRIREQAAHAVARRIEDVHVDVAVRFSGVQVRPSELLSLSVGDVMPLGHTTTTPLSVTAADITFAHAVPGTQGKRLACLVVEPPIASEETK